MATRTRTFWEWWDCTSCDNKHIRGDQKRCPTCGNPRENPELQAGYLGRSVDPVSGKVLATDNITDATELAEALSGADWYCSQCETGNRDLDTACVSCGSLRYAAQNPKYVPDTPETDPVPPRQTWQQTPSDPQPEYSSPPEQPASIPVDLWWCAGIRLVRLGSCLVLSDT